MIIVVFISFIMSLFVAIQDPIIQNFAIRIAGGYLSSKTGADVKIGRLYISPDFTIHLEKFSVKDLNNSDLLKVEELIVRPIMQDIVNGDINIDLVELNDANANLITYEGEKHLNFQFLIDAFDTGKPKKKDTPSIPIQVNKIVVNDLDFQFWDQNKDTVTTTGNGLMNYAHIVVNDINLNLEGLNIVGDSITAMVHRLAAVEQSGFTLNHLGAKVNVSPSGILLDSLNLETNNSQLDLDLHLLYPRYKALGSFLDSVIFDSKIRQSDLLLSDLGPFSKVLYDMPDLIRMEGLMKGPIKRFQLNKLKVRIGDATRFDGDITLEPIDFLNGNQMLNIKKLNYSYDDLARFRIPGPSKTIPLPPMLKALGKGTIDGVFSGSMDKFIADLNVTSEIGNLKADITKHRNEWNYDVYEGYINAEHLDIGTLANASNVIKTISLESNVICRIGKGNDIDLDIDGNAYDAILLGNSIDEISMNGNLHKNQFNGKISIEDDELDLDFKGRFDFSDPKSLGGDFQADIVKADLNKLNIIKDDEEASLSASITADMTSINNFNNAEGNLIINDLVFANRKGKLVMDELTASIANDNLLQKKIQLDCDFFDFTMAGKMDFATIATSFKQYLNSYVTIPQWQEELEAFEQEDRIANQDFIVQMNLKNPKPLTQMFIPNISIAKNTSFNGTFTSRSNMLNLTMRSKYLNINNIKINNIECRSQSSPRRSSTRLHLDNIILRDSTEKSPSVIGLDDLSIVANLRNDSIMTDILWDDATIDDHNRANIRTAMVINPNGGRFSIYESSILLNDTLWTFNPNNFIEIDSSNIQLSNVELVSNNQSIKIDGRIPNTVNDTLFASFNHFNLSNINFILEGKGMELAGRVNGKAQVSDIKEKPTLVANLLVKDFGINGKVFGDAEILSLWDNERESIDLDLGLIEHEHKTIDLKGAFYPRREQDNLDFNLGINDLNLGILEPFAQGIAQRIQGLGNGSLSVKGELSRPQVDGSLKIKEGGAKIDFLNTYYTFSPSITINDSLISINEFSLTDTLGNSASVVGHVSHDRFKDFYLNLRMAPRDFLAMASNASTSPSFYGTAIASGIVEVKGPFNDIELSVRARTNKGTVMTIPIGGKTSVRKHDFIVFVDNREKAVDEEEVVVVEKKEKPANNFRIGLNLAVNSDAQIKIALPDGLGAMEARGDGNIRLGVSRNDLSLIGDYVISDGSLSLNIQDLIHKSFSLDPGSRISWTGDPVNGTINATGVYQTKASLASLGLGDSTNMNNTNVKVECLVRLKDKLMNPEITFGLRLPNATEDLQQAVFSIIDTTNQSVVFTQTLYLLAFNSFNYGESFDGMGLVTGQLTDYLSKFVSDLDINFNYKAGTDYNNEEMTVAMRKQLFDDRLTIETNFGVIIPTNTYTNSSTAIVGDVNMDYKITKDGRFSAQVFNRSNYNTMYYQYSYYKMAPYTQGIGLSYNKSFDKFKDIFKKQPVMIRPNRPFIEKRDDQTQDDNESSE